MARKYQRLVKVLIRCAYCGHLFSAGRKDAVTCGPACRQALWRWLRKVARIKRVFTCNRKGGSRGKKKKATKR